MGSGGRFYGAASQETKLMLFEFLLIMHKTNGFDGNMIANMNKNVSLSLCYQNVKYVLKPFAPLFLLITIQIVQFCKPVVVYAVFTFVFPSNQLKDPHFECTSS